MLRALSNHVNSSVRSNPRFSLYRNNYVSTLSSLSHKNQVEGTGTTLEELSQLYKTAEGSEVETESRAVGGMNVGLKEKGRRREDMKMDGAPRKTSESVEEMVKAAAVGAMETGLKLGKIAKHTMDGMWEIAEKTTESVRDSVANDSAHRRPSEHNRVDKAGGGGYDLKYGR